MPSYRGLQEDTEANRRTIDRLLALREQLDRDVPKRTLNENLLLATFNIREFDSPKYGPRLDEAYYYLAEIIDRFDLVAIQEVYKDLDALDRLMEVLGGRWKYLFTDVTEGRRGNDERMTFLYDSRTVDFRGLAGEIVMAPLYRDKKYVPVLQFARTPYVCGFSSNWTDFMLTSVHILFGEDVRDDPRRVAEIQQVSQFLRDRVHDDHAWSRNLILLGDFNIFNRGDVTMQAIEDVGFTIPEEIKSLPPSAPLRGRKYDQIAFYVREDKFGFTGRAGVFDYYESVFRLKDEQAYAGAMGERYHTTSRGRAKTARESTTYYKSYWRTYQMSDHLPMWVELKIDYSDEYLERTAEEWG